MNDSDGRPAACFGATALALSIASSLLYFAFSDGFRYLVEAILSAGRNLTVVA